MYRRSVFGILAVLLTATSANAAVIINPLPPIPAGTAVSIQRFASLPASSLSGSRALAQQLQPIRDGSGRLIVNDTRGILYLTNPSGSAPSPYFDIRTQSVGFSNAANGTQTGLMSFAFHPNFGVDPTKAGYNTFYTMDTSAVTGQASWAVPGVPANHDNVVHEWTVADPRAPTATILSSREVLRVAQPFSDHGPGTIAFNPAAKAGTADYGALYIGFGDGGSANDPYNSAQNIQSPFGKILRIDPVDPDGSGPQTYSIPVDNPFVAKGDARAEVWAYGLRNPQQFSFDQATGKMLIADIGQNQIEEVNLGVAGANYGWPIREGTFARSPDKSNFDIFDFPANDGTYTDPLAQYDHEEIFRDGHNLAGIGGAFLYTGSEIPELFGKVVLDDLVSGRLFYFTFQDAVDGMQAPLSELFLTLNGLSTTMLELAGTSNDANGRVDLRLGQDANGEIYLLTKRDGEIFRLSGSVPEPGTWLLLLAGFAMIARVMRVKSQSRALSDQVHSNVIRVG